MRYYVTVPTRVKNTLFYLNNSNLISLSLILMRLFIHIKIRIFQFNYTFITCSLFFVVKYIRYFLWRNMKEILLNNLNLEEGYYISSITEDECIYIDIDYDLKLTRCPQCEVKTKIHDRLQKTWRHTDYRQKKVYIRFKNPRATCDAHGVKVSTVNWAKPKHRFTIELEDIICELAKNKSFLQIAKQLDEHDTRIRRIVKRSNDEKNI